MGVVGLGASAPGRWRTAASTTVRVLGWVGPPLAVLALSFFYPVILLARRSFMLTSGSGWTVGRYDGLVHSQVFLHSLVTTVEIAGFATLGCVVFGLLLAISLSFVAFRGGGIMGRLVDIVIAFPSFLIVLAFVFLYGSSGAVNVGLQHRFGLSIPPLSFLDTPVGSILAEIVYYTPFVLRPMLASYSQMDPAQIEAASNLGARPWRVIARVVIPYGGPSLLAGGGLALVLTINEFGIKLFLGAKNVTTPPLLIYSQAIPQLDLPTPAAVAIINAAVSLALYAVYRIFAGRVSGARMV